MAAKKISAAAAAAKAQAAAIFNLATVTGTRDFVDHYTKLEAAAKALEAQMEGLKELIKETGRDILLGTETLIDVNIFEQTRFDSATAKKFLTPTQIALCDKKSDSYRITVKERPDLDQIADVLVNAIADGVEADEIAGIKASDVAIWGSHAE